MDEVVQILKNYSMELNRWSKQIFPNDSVRIKEIKGQLAQIQDMEEAEWMLDENELTEELTQLWKREEMYGTKGLV